MTVPPAGDAEGAVGARRLGEPPGPDPGSHRAKGPSEETGAHEPRMVTRLRASRERYRRRSPIYRAAWVIAGFLVTLAGLGMLALPGPAFVVIPIGLAMLSLQFRWAGRLLEKALQQAQVAQEKASETSPRERIIIGILVALAVAAFVVAAILWEIPFVPFV